MRNSIALALLTFSTGCSLAPIQMEVNPAIAIIQPLAVEGRNPRRSDRPISFGKWRTVTLDEGAVGRTSAGIITAGSHPTTLSAAKSSQTFRFGLASVGETIVSECRTERRALSAVHTKGKTTDTTEIVAPNDPALECEFFGAPAGSLRLTSETSLTADREAGEVQFGGTKWSIRSVNHFQGERIAASGARYGYELLDGGQFIGAVETVNRGRVWIDPSLPALEQDRLAVVSAALLLYQPEKLEIDDDL